MKSGFLLLLLLALPVCAATTVDSIAVANRVARDMDTRAGLKGSDLGLDELYRLVLDNNPAIQTARHGLEQASGQKLVFRSAALPRATLGLPAGHLGPKGDSESRTFILLTGQFSQPLFDVSVPPNWRLGDLALPAAQQNLNLTLSSQLHAARQAYLRALHARALLGILDEINGALERNQQFEQKRVDAGLGARSDLIRAEVQKLNRRPERDAFLNEYQRQIVTLANLAGSDLSPSAPLPFRPLGHLAYRPLTLNLTQLNEEAQAARPDVALLELLLRQNAEQLRLAGAGYYPTIRLIANGQAVPGGAFTDRQSNTIRSGDDVENTEILFGPSLTWQIYDGGATDGRKESAAARRDLAALRLQELRDNIPRALATVSRRLRSSEEKIRVLGSNVALAERTLAITEKSLEAGQAGQLDILEAQRSLFDTKAGLLNALLEHALSLAEIDLITGRYLHFNHAHQPAPNR
ncbi:MAG: TolC family protein [Verrucomicrobiia bacterium]